MATSIVRPTANRAVHLTFTPRPSNLGESREILRLISQFGEVEYFKNFKYDTLSSPTTAIVIFKEEEAARYCLQKSPIRFRMGKAPVVETPDEPSAASHLTQDVHTIASATGLASSAPFGLSQTRAMSTRSLPTPPRRPVQSPFDPPKSPPPLESRIFQIRVNPSRRKLRDQINHGHYHGGFALDTKSIPQQDLAKRVPYPGLSCIDWRAEEKPWRVMLKVKKMENEGPSRRKPLSELYEEGPSQNISFRDESLPG